MLVNAFPSEQGDGEFEKSSFPFPFHVFDSFIFYFIAI